MDKLCQNWVSCKNIDQLDHCSLGAIKLHQQMQLSASALLYIILAIIICIAIDPLLLEEYLILANCLFL